MMRPSAGGFLRRFEAFDKPGHPGQMAEKLRRVCRLDCSQPDQLGHFAQARSFVSATARCRRQGFRNGAWCSS
jgi:hypothetical protein